MTVSTKSERKWAKYQQHDGMSAIFFNTTEFYKHHSLSFCTTTLFGTKKTSFYPVQKLSDYLRRKEDTSSRWRPSLSSQRSHVKKVVSCWDKNGMTVIRSDSWDHWLVTESLFTLSSTIKSSLSDAMPFTYFLPIFQTAYCLSFISGHTWLLALNSFLTWIISMVEKLRSSLSPVLWSRPQSDILPLKAHILTPYSLFRQQKPAELIDESL